MLETAANWGAKWGERALDAVLAAILLTIVLLTLAQVLWRYIIGASFTWSEELNLMLWAWLISLAAIKAQHLRIDLVVSLLPARMQIALYALRCVVSLLILTILFWFGLNMVALTSLDFHVELDWLSRKWLFMSLCVATVPWGLVVIARTWLTIAATLRQQERQRHAAPQTIVSPEAVVAVEPDGHGVRGVNR